MEFLIFKVLLLISNFAVLTYLLMIVIQHYQSNYDRKSWAFLFHILSFMWLLIRGIFWLATLTSFMKWSSTTFFVLYWMPTPLEFGAFMLLPLYFAQILYPAEWKKYWSYVRPVYFGFIFGIFLFQSVWSYWRPSDKDKHCDNVVDDYFAEECFRTEDSSSAFREITAVCFLFLAFIQCWFGVKVLKMDHNRYDQFLATKPEILSFVNAALVVSFASRSFYQIMAINQLMVLPDVPLQPNDGDVPLSILLACELWIYIPTLLVLLYFTSQSMGNAPKPKFEYYLNYYQNAAFDEQEIDEDEQDYEMLLKEVPSRQGSFWSHHHDHSIPIKISIIPETGEVVYPSSSFPRGQSWLSEPDHHRFLKPVSLDNNKSHSQEREGTLLSHFKRFRQRGLSAGSDTSSVEGNPAPRSKGSSQHSLPKGKRSHARNTQASSSSSSSRRKVRYYDEAKNEKERKIGRLPPTASSLSSESTHDVQRARNLSVHTLSTEEEEEEEEQENSEEEDLDEEQRGISRMTRPGHRRSSRQYELMVEPPSPSPLDQAVHGIAQEEMEKIQKMEHKDSFRGIESIRISSYEASGGDHVHANHHRHRVSSEQDEAADEESLYSSQNLYYNHAVALNPSQTPATAAGLLPSDLHPIYPRPSRHHNRANNHFFSLNTRSNSNSSNTDSPKVPDRRTFSFSPQIAERVRSADNTNTSTPDRDEAAQEIRLRRDQIGLRYSPP